MGQYVNGTRNPWGEVYRRHSLERMPGQHKLHGWTVGTIANISCWGGWEWIMYVLGKRLPHSGVEGVERVGVGGTFLLKLAFLIKIIVCIDLEDTVWRENNAQISKGEQVAVIWTHKKPAQMQTQSFMQTSRQADIHKWNQRTKRNFSRLRVLLIWYCLHMPYKWMLHLSSTTLSNYC